ncbi:alpha/beta fold hydrolase [Neisseria weixii]|uniref:alpha/beta fold hydrolase n=1 Tax=Neisseria weixii TaxID=1853276 RepID=UPI0035A09A63
MMTATANKLLFLPGASGSTEFWQPVIDRLSPPLDCVIQAYPGFWGEPPQPDVNSLDDLSRWIVGQIQEPVIPVAQSMGGIIAVQAALQKPHLVQGLVLAATSGGMDMRRFAAADWRTDYRVEMAQLPQWFADAPQDFMPDFARIRQKTLLIWGGNDAISPLAAGKFLQRTLPDAQLAVIPQGGHDMAFSHPEEVARLIRQFVSALADV